MVVHLHPARIENIENLGFTEFQASSQFKLSYRMDADFHQALIPHAMPTPLFKLWGCMSSRPVAALVVLAQNRLVVVLTTQPIGR